MGADQIFSTNSLGDVIEAIDADGTSHPIDPSDWGWLRTGGANDPGELRRSVPSLVWLPGFQVTEAETFAPVVPGPKKRGRWMEWKPGSAPAAAVTTSDLGGGTLAYFDRLSEAAGHVADALPRRRRPSGEATMTIWDFVGGRSHEVTYSAPGPLVRGTGRVYVIEDGIAVKVGFTSGAVAARIKDLQTGNPRRISVIAEIANATEETEAALHRALNTWHVSGEWFARDAVVDQIAVAGSAHAWLESVPGLNGLPIIVHPPYLPPPTR